MISTRWDSWPCSYYVYIRYQYIILRLNYWKSNSSSSSIKNSINKQSASQPDRIDRMLCMGYLRPPGLFFYEMRCEILILIFDVKIDSILISFLIFHLRFLLILIFICDVKRGLNANFNYWINSKINYHIGFDIRFEIPADTNFDYWIGYLLIFWIEWCDSGKM